MIIPPNVVIVWCRARPRRVVSMSPLSRSTVRCWLAEVAEIPVPAATSLVFQEPPATFISTRARVGPSSASNEFGGSASRDASPVTVRYRH